MERLLELLDQKDVAKAELAECEQRDAQPKPSPAQLIERAPSYNLFEPVFLPSATGPSTTNDTAKSFAARVAPPSRVRVLGL